MHAERFNSVLDDQDPSLQQFQNLLLLILITQTDIRLLSRRQARGVIRQ